jgi:hypothetical protein
MISLNRCMDSYLMQHDGTRNAARTGLFLAAACLSSTDARILFLGVLRGLVELMVLLLKGSKRLQRTSSP